MTVASSPWGRLFIYNRLVLQKNIIPIEIFCYYIGNMFLAIAILIVQSSTFVSYLIDSQFFANPGSQNMRSMLFFIGLFTLLLSIPTMVWNHSMMKYSIKSKEKVGFVLAIVVCVLAVFLFATWYVTGIHKVGATVF